MKQGRATHSGSASTKVEPTPHAANLTAVSRLGNKIGNHAMEQPKPVNVRHAPLYEGRGLKAPMAGSTSHRSGSQGTHK